MLLDDRVNNGLDAVELFDRPLDEDIPLRGVGYVGLGDLYLRATFHLQRSYRLPAPADYQADHLVWNGENVGLWTGRTVRCH